MADLDLVVNAADRAKSALASVASNLRNTGSAADEVSEQVNEMSGSFSAAFAAGEGFEEQLDDIAREADHVQEEINEATASIGGLTGAMGAASVATRSFEGKNIRNLLESDDFGEAIKDVGLGRQLSGVRSQAFGRGAMEADMPGTLGELRRRFGTLRGTFSEERAGKFDRAIAQMADMNEVTRLAIDNMDELESRDKDLLRTATRRMDEDTVPLLENVRRSIREMKNEVDDPELADSFSRLERKVGDVDRRMLKSVVDTRKFRQQIKKLSDDIDSDKLDRALRTAAEDFDRREGIPGFRSRLTEAAFAEGIEDEKRRKLIDVDVRGALEAMGELEGVDIALEQIDNSTEQASRSTRELAASFGGLNTALGASMALMTSSVGPFRIMAHEADNAADQMEELNDEMNSLSNILGRIGPSFRNASLNIGPFNLSLRNLGSTLLALLAVIGPLIAVISGVAAAFLAATAAVVAFMGVGLLGLTEELEQNFAGIENKMQAMEAIAKGLKEALLDAIEPLTEVSFAGMGPIEFLLENIRSIVFWVRQASEVLATLLEQDAVVDFFFRVRNALVGIGSDISGITLSEVFESEEFAETMEIMTNIIVFLIDKFPDFLMWASRVTSEFAPALGRFTMALITLTIAMSDLGVEVMDFLLPVLATMMELIAGAAMFLADFAEKHGLLAHVIFAVVGGLFILTGLFVKLAIFVANMIALYESLRAIQNAVTISTNATTVSMWGLRAALLGVAGALVLLGVGLVTGAVKIKELGKWSRVAGAALIALGTAIGAVQVGIISWAGLLASVTAIGGILANVIYVVVAAVAGLVGGISALTVGILALIAAFVAMLIWPKKAAKVLDWLANKFGFLRKMAQGFRKDVVQAGNAWQRFAGMFDWLAGGTDEFVGRALSGGGAGPRPTGPGRGQTTVNVNVDNSGSGNMSDRDANRVGRTAAQKFKNESRSR